MVDDVVDRTLVIAGSDPRGAIYGIYHLSQQIGVSPWYWWADVPVTRHAAVYALPGRYVDGGPAVRYRGFFLNDEAPALTGWVNATFGGYGHRFYERVFELLLRLKARRRRLPPASPPPATAPGPHPRPSARA